MILLLRKSDEGGGGDFFGYHKGYGEGSPVPADAIAGRWAGDRIVMIGDYDSSKLWGETPRYRNIARELAETWNAFIELPDAKLTYRECSCHGKRQPVAA